jgi:hypothetical protein
MQRTLSPRTTPVATDLIPQQSVLDFGATCDGVTDDTAAIGSAFAALAGTGVAAYFPPCATPYVIASGPIAVPSDLTILGSPGAKLMSTMPAARSFPGNYIFLAEGTQVNDLGFLSSTPTIGGLSLVVNIDTEPTVGQWIAVWHNESEAIYNVLSVSGTQSLKGPIAPWTVTVDRPIVFPWTANDAVSEYSTLAHDITIVGNGLTFSGTGDQSLEFAQCTGIDISGIRYVPTDGLIASAVVGFDVGCTNSELTDADFDLTGSTGSANGVYIQSNEGTVLSNVSVENAYACGFLVLDSYSSGIEDSWATGCSRGFQVSHFSPATLGNYYPWVSGGGAIGSSSIGLDVNGTVNLDVTDFSADYGALYGVLVENDSNVVGLSLSGVSAVANQIGILVGSGTTNTLLQNIDVSYSSGVGLALASEANVDGLTALELTGSSAIQTGSGSVRVSDFRISSAASDFYAVTIVSSGSLALRNGTIDMTGPIGGVAVYAETDGIMTTMQDVWSTYPRGYGLYLASGSTARLQDSDFSGCAIPLAVAQGANALVAQ